MKLSVLSIHRPVLAVVMTLALVLFGTVAFLRLPIRELPDIDTPVVSVTVQYPGATAQVVETQVTRILEDQLSGIESLRTLTSVSREETAQITLEFEFSRNVDAAVNDVRDRLYAARRGLPTTIAEPVISKAGGNAEVLVWLSLFSDRHSELEITEFAERFVKDRLAAGTGVSAVSLSGSRRYAMRIWLDADRLGARGLTVQDVEAALRDQNVAIPSGRIESERLEFPVRTHGELATPEQFNRLIVAYRDGYPIRLQDVGRAEIGAEDTRKFARLNGRPCVTLGVMKQSKANALEVAQGVRATVASLQGLLPPGMSLKVASDRSLHIERSIKEVYGTMLLSVVLVVVVIYLFLGSLRATIIPTAAIPASIVGTFALMQPLGFSINLLTLLGFVLAVGLVVDDAIVVLENIHRRIEQGQPPMRAALDGSREIGFAVIATTISLVAVFVPIAFLTNATARLFAELALAVAGSVLISGFIALTLTPMMSARLLKGRRAAGADGPVAAKVRGLLGRVVDGYRRLLCAALRARHAVTVVALAAIVVGTLLFLRLPSELTPLEDTGAFGVNIRAPEGSTVLHTNAYTKDIEALYAQVPEIASYFTWVGGGGLGTKVTEAGGWVTLKDWKERRRSQQEIVAELAGTMSQIPGVIAFPFNPGGSGARAPVQFVIGGSSYDELEKSVGLMMEAAKGNPGLLNVGNDLALSKPELEVDVDRDKAADLGVSIADVGRTLETLLGGRVVTMFGRNGKEYPVMVKILDQDRRKPSDIGTLFVRGHGGELIQLGSLVTIHEQVVPTELNHFAKMRASVISAALAEGYALGDALEFLERMVRERLPQDTPVGYAGASREFKEARRDLPIMFVLGLLTIYLVLAAQFESFVHPVTILLSVPPALTGAFLALDRFGGTLNIYSEIGLIMLVGLVTKNAILIVDFSNKLRAEGLSLTEAVIEGAARRLRPILMTTAATILGALPLALATGAGAVGRRQLGYVIVAGLFFSTLLTLVIVPVMYVQLSWRTERRGDGDRADRGESEREATSPLEPASTSPLP